MHFADEIEIKKYHLEYTIKIVIKTNHTEKEVH